MYHRLQKLFNTNTLINKKNKKRKEIKTIKQKKIKDKEQKNKN